MIDINSKDFKIWGKPPKSMGLVKGFCFYCCQEKMVDYDPEGFSMCRRCAIVQSGGILITGIRRYNKKTEVEIKDNT